MVLDPEWRRHHRLRGRGRPRDRGPLAGPDQYLGNYANDHVRTCHVTGKDRGGSNGSYRIYTDGCGTLSNHDSWLRGKTNSADIQGRIPDKGVITVEVAGVRFGPTSAMPNIIKIVSTN